MPPQTQTPIPPQAPAAPPTDEPEEQPVAAEPPVEAEGSGLVLVRYLAQAEQQPNTLDPVSLAFVKLLADQLGKDETVTPQMYAEFTAGMLDALSTLNLPEHPDFPYQDLAQQVQALPSIDPIRETAFQLASLAYGEEFGKAVQEAYQLVLADEQAPTWGSLTDPNAPLDLSTADAPFDDPGPGPRPEDLGPDVPPEPTITEQKVQQALQEPLGPEEEADEAGAAAQLQPEGQGVVIQPQAQPGTVQQPQAAELPEPTDTDEAEDADDAEPANELVVSHDENENEEPKQ